MQIKVQVKITMPCGDVRIHDADTLNALDRIVNSVKSAEREYLATEPIESFAKTLLMVTRDPNDRLTGGDLTRAFEGWKENCGYGHIQGRNFLYRHIRQKLKVSEIRSGNKVVFLGIKLVVSMPNKATTVEDECDLI